MVTLIIDSCCDFVKTSERTPCGGFDFHFMLAYFIFFFPASRNIPWRDAATIECNGKEERVTLRDITMFMHRMMCS